MRFVGWDLEVAAAVTLRSPAGWWQLCVPVSRE